MPDEQAAAPDPETDRALGKMSFMEHLGELRTRIMWSLVSAGVGIIIAFFLFLIGGAFAMLIIIPYASNFLVTFGQEKGWKPMLTVSSYTDFVIKFALAFGVVFELPVVITILSLIGVVTPQFLSKNRKYAILINFIIAAVLTPTPDMINQTLMAGPLCILYEVGIICARLAVRKRKTPAPEPPAETPAPPTP